MSRLEMYKKYANNYVKAITKLRKENLMSFEEVINKFQIAEEVFFEEEENEIEENYDIPFDFENVDDINDFSRELVLAISNYKLLIDILEEEYHDNYEYDIYIHEGSDMLPATYCNTGSKFTEYGKKLFKDILYLPIHPLGIYPYDKSRGPEYSIIELDVNSEEIEKIQTKLNTFLTWTAGYCTQDRYDKIFGEGKYENNPIYDSYDLQLDIYDKYGWDIDVDELGSKYDDYLKFVKEDKTKEEFDEFFGFKED